MTNQDETQHAEIKVDRQSLDFTSHRVSNSNCLSDCIRLPLDQALAVIARMWHNPGYHDSLLAVLENEIRDAQQVAARCQCEVKEGGTS